MMKGYDIICFANDWQADPLSKKHLMLRLAKANRILWVNSLHNRRPRMATKDVRRVVQKLREFFRGIRNVQENIWVVTPLYIPFMRHGWIRRLNRWLLQKQLLAALWRLGFRRPITWTFAPTSADVAGTLGESLVIYHCVDDFAAFSDAAVRDVLQGEKKLLEKADVVLAASLPLVELKRAVNRNTYLLRHGVDYEHFQRSTLDSTPIAPELENIPGPILGFHGWVADWVDVVVLADIARSRPDWSLVLVGKVDTDIEILRKLPNVHLLGHKPYARLPEFLRGFSVALLPFAEGPLTHSANPLKLREYLAAGLPVVSSPLPEVLALGSLVRTARTADDYIRAIEEVLGGGDAGPSAQRAMQMANESWDHRVAEVAELLEPWLCAAREGEPHVPSKLTQPV